MGKKRSEAAEEDEGATPQRKEFVEVPLKFPIARGKGQDPIETIKIRRPRAGDVADALDTAKGEQGAQLLLMSICSGHHVRHLRKLEMPDFFECLSEMNALIPDMPDDMAADLGLKRVGEDANEDEDPTGEE